MKNISDKLVEKFEVCILYWIFFWCYVEKYWVLQVTDENMVHAHFMLDT